MAATGTAHADVVTAGMQQDEDCESKGPRSFDERTVFKRSSSGRLHIEGGVAEISFWGFAMDFASATVEGSGLTISKLHTRSGPQNVSQGCPADSGTLTVRFSSPLQLTSDLNGTIVIKKPGNDIWRIPVVVHTAPTSVEVGWDRKRGPAASSGNTRGAIRIINSGNNCTPGTPGCPTSSGGIQFQNTGAPATVNNTPPDFAPFLSIQQCLAEQGGSATLQALTSLIVKVPRDRTITCKGLMILESRNTGNGVEIFAASGPDSYVSRPRVLVPQSSAIRYFDGVSSADDFFVVINWAQIQQRFQPRVAPPVSSQPESPSLTGTRDAINGNSSPTAPSEPQIISAEIDLVLNGRKFGPLRVRIEPVQ
jgi:hypothetical protein